MKMLRIKNIHFTCFMYMKKRAYPEPRGARSFGSQHTEKNAFLVGTGFPEKMSS